MYITINAMGPIIVMGTLCFSVLRSRLRVLAFHMYRTISSKRRGAVLSDYIDVWASSFCFAFCVWTHMPRLAISAQYHQISLPASPFENNLA